MFRIFQKPAERLKSALEDVRQRKPNSTAGLRAALTKDGREVAEGGDTGRVCEAYHELALVLIDANQAGTAITTVDEMRHLAFGSEQALVTSLVLIGHPSLGEADILRLGGWLSESGRLKDAVSGLRSALEERFRRSSPLAILLGDALVEAGEAVEAAQRFRMALDLNRDEGPALLPRFEKLAALLPKDCLTQQTLGWLYFIQRNYPRAIQHLENALTLGEIEPGLLFALSDAYLETKNYARAVDIFERLLKQGANAAELIRRCDQLIDHYSKQDWISRRTIRLLGDVLRSQQRPDEALARYRQALENLEVEEANVPFAQAVLERLLEIENLVLQNSHAEYHLVTALAYLLVGKPTESTQRCLQAVQADRSAGLAAVEALSRIIMDFPNHRPALIELVHLQLELEDYPAALAALDQFRQGFPEQRSETVGDYKTLLSRLDGLKATKTFTSESYLRTLTGALDALAEETASKDPASTLAYLERLLALAGDKNASRVLDQVHKLGLVEVAPVSANLLLADANLILGQFNEALDACKVVPVEQKNLEAVISRLEQIASRDAFPVLALLYATHMHLALKLVTSGLPYARRAFEADSTTASPFLLERLEAVRKQGDLPGDGLSLLSDALLLKPDPARAEWLLGVLQDLLTKSDYGMEVVEKADRFLPFLADGSVAAYRYLLLQADAWKASGALVESTGMLQQALLHSMLKLDDVMERLEKITSLENAPALAWLALGDAILLSKKTDLMKVNQVYRKALEKDAFGISGMVQERLAAITTKKGSPVALAFHALKARAIAGQEKNTEAINEGREILITFGSQAVEEVLALADLLPDGVETWYLRAEAEITREKGEIAASWMDMVSQKGNDALVKRTEATLQDWIQRFPKQPALRLSHAIALNRLGQSEAASSELSSVATDFPAARSRAMELLNTILEKAQNAATWMEMARGLLAQDNIPQTLDYLRKAWAEPGFAGKAYELLKELKKRHPKDPSVLRAMVELETVLGDEDNLQAAVGHTYEWLAVESNEAGEAATVLEATIQQSIQVLPEDHPIGLKVRLARVDALLAAGQGDQAAIALENVMDIWTKEYQPVQERAETWLQKQETKSIRLVFIQANLNGKDYAAAFQSLEGMRYTEPEDISDFIKIAERMVEDCQGKEPRLAGKACRLIAGWQVELQALDEVKEAVFQACQLDKEMIPDVLTWLAGAGWDEGTRRSLEFSRAEICCRAGEEYYPTGLAIYSDLLQADFDRNVNEVLSGLRRYPKEFWPVHQLELDIFTHLNPESYPQVFVEMKVLLDGFGSTHADEMLIALEKMDKSIAGTHMMRADIYEVCMKLEASAVALLGMQQAIPDQLDVIENKFQELIGRYPGEYCLQIAYGDAERAASKWPEALQIYRTVQNKSPENIIQLVNRYQDLLVHQPDDCLVRWALAEAHRELEHPDEAALYLDQITDLENEAEKDASDFAVGLVKRWPHAGAAWFVSGKLAYRKGDWAETLRMLERARKEGLVDLYQVRLHDMLARAYHATGALEKALADIRQAVTLAPDDPAIRQELVSLRLALMDAQISQQKKVLEGQPGNYQAAMDLAESQIQRGQVKEALALLQPLLGGLAPQGKIHLGMARCFSANGLQHLAAASLQSALNTGQLTSVERKETLYRQASALRHLMRFDEAIQALETILLEDLDYLNTCQLLDEIQREKVVSRISPGIMKPGSHYLPEEGQGR
jgi:tetratricopeptide (TPR) repeat protein